MMWKWVAAAVGGALNALFSVLPTVTMPTVTGPAGFGGDLVWINWLFPASETLGYLVWTFTYVFPAVAAYVVINWVYRHLPNVAGTGPGAG